MTKHKIPEDEFTSLQSSLAKHKAFLEKRLSTFFPGALVEVNAKSEASSYEKSFNKTIGMVLGRELSEHTRFHIRVLLNEKIMKFHVLDIELVEIDQTEETQNK